MRVFADRAEAGTLLGRALARQALLDPVVLGIPRGGVVVAAGVARLLHGAPLDVVVPRKLGAPHNAELAIGAVAPGVVVLDRPMLASLHVSDAYVTAEIARQEREIARRAHAYRGGRPAVSLHDRTAIVVDDGIATGSTAVAALRWASAHGAACVVMAAPVAPPGVRARLEHDADEVVLLDEPAGFFAVGQYYADFRQVSDEEVIALLAPTVSPR
jgi:predicted phosphoribosyltransferase